MTLKHAIWLSVAWTILVIGVSVGIIWYIVTHEMPGATGEERAARLGQGMGIAAGIGYGIIWLPYASAVGKRRREAAAKERELSN